MVDGNTFAMVGGLLVVVFIVAIGAWLVKNTTDSGDTEMSKIRFMAATSAGIMALVVFATVLYFVSPDGPGKDIFSVIFPASNALIGGIVGWIIGK